jgi:hypothetical protein
MTKRWIGAAIFRKLESSIGVILGFENGRQIGILMSSNMPGRIEDETVVHSESLMARPPLSLD